MGEKLHKPILIGGIGLSVTLWLWDSFGNSLLEVGEWSLSGTIALGGALWLLQKRKKQITELVKVNVDAETLNQAIAQNQQMLDNLIQEAPELDITILKKEQQELPQLLDRENLTISLIGNRKTGKTSLKTLLENRKYFSVINWQEISTDSEELEINNSDLLLYLVNGDLTDSEWEKLQLWYRLNHNLILVFNKEDQYTPEEQILIISQLKQRVKSIISETNVMAISASPKPIKFRQHQSDGEIREWLEEIKPNVDNLAINVNNILEKHSRELILATTWRETINLQKQIKNLTNQVRFRQALPIIEQYQWLAAAGALANPLAAVDILITVAINGQMIVDLGKIYQQQFSLSQAQTVAANLGELMLKLGLVEISTQSIAGMLKTNAITYVAGGSLQGISAAYLTRVAGLSLVEYFQEQDMTTEGWNLEKLGTKIKQVFAQNQPLGLIQSLVRQTV